LRSVDRGGDLLTSGLSEYFYANKKACSFKSFCYFSIEINMPGKELKVKNYKLKDKSKKNLIYLG